MASAKPRGGARKGRPQRPAASAGQVSAAQPAYLKKVDEAVREQFAGAMALSAFLAQSSELSVADRILIVRQALVLIEQNYAHLPLKRAMHSIDPVQRLRLLLQGLQHAKPDEVAPEVEFHREMTDIFTALRDLHTNYLLPEPFNRMVAFLPFMVEDFVEDGDLRYLVSHVMPGFTHPTFKEGVEIRYWNGMPIRRAVAANAQRYAGSNREARHARGVQTLTTRALVIAPPPDEEWVIVGYRDGGGEHELRFDWMVNGASGGDASAENAVQPMACASLGLDLEQDTIQRTRKILFKPEVVKAEKRAAGKKARREAFSALDSSLPQVFQAQPVSTPKGTFGHLRIRTFNHWPPDEFVAEFIRLVTALPPNGLIIDVRGNGGGVIMNGELILQTLTPRRIEPEPAQFLNTGLNLQICERHAAESEWANLSPWVDSMRQALQTGATFSAGFPITDPDACNAIGQKYFGPVALIVDALCYSTTDIFAAGFQDHDIGPIIGVDASTGAGGANVWTHQHLAELVLPGEDSVYLPLPGDAAMRVSIRRTLRVGKRAGTPVEDLGVVADHVHRLTRADLLEGNVDLLAKAAALIADRPARRLTATIKRSAAAAATLTVETRGIDRLDVYAAGRPVQSTDVNKSKTIFPLATTADVAIEIRGFDAGEQVARYLTHG